MATANVTPDCQKQNPPIAVTGHDLIKQAEKISVHWWSIIESVLESAKYGQGKDQPLPQWAIERLEDKGALNTSYDQHRVNLEMARQALNLAEGKVHDHVYEIWTGRVGHRLEVRHESMGLAQIAMDKVKAKYPDAFIARVRVRSPVYGNDDPALLNTLVGRLWWAGTWLGDNENDAYFAIQDSTGRTVTALASTLVAHKEVMSRLSEDARKRIEFELDDKKERKAVRKAAKAVNNV